MKPGTRWILAIASLLAINMLAAILLMVCAHGRGASQVLPAYQQEARTR